MTCPALDAPLCSRCCGSGRGSVIDCTPDCPTNPFGTKGYDRYHEIDTALTSKLFRLMGADGYDVHRMRRESKRFDLARDGDDPVATGGFGAVQDWIYHQRDADGMTRVERWEAAGWPGFSNDERQLLRMRRNSELTLIELQSVEADHTTRVRDLLEGDPQRAEHHIFDYSLVRQFMPYQVLFGYITRLRHFTTLQGNVVGVELEVVDDLVAFIRERSGSSEPSAQKSWLRLHSPEVSRESRRLADAARERLISGVDLSLLTVVYQSDREPDAWVDFLLAYPEFEAAGDEEWEDTMEVLYGPVHHRFEWLRRGGASQAPRTSAMRMRVESDGRGSVQALATIDIHERHVVLSGVDRGLMEWLRDRWSSEIAPGLHEETAGIRDLKQSGSSPSIRSAVPARETRPPSILEDENPMVSKDLRDDLSGVGEGAISAEKAAVIMKRFEEEHFGRLIDEAVPMFGHRTPREVSESQDPGLRKELERWAKSMIHSHAEKAKKHGFIPEVYWFYRELGMAHLWPTDWPRES